MVLKIKGENMKILYVSSEVIPFAKTGGLADVAGALPNELTKLGHEVVVVMPLYQQISKEKYNLKLAVSDISIDIGSEQKECAVYKGVLPGGKTATYFIENKEYFDRKGLYQDADSKDYADNAQRFIFFSRAVLELCKKLNWRPDVINCNDWQTGLIPVYVKSIYANDPIVGGVKTVITIHNLAYQGVFEKEVMEVTGLGWDYFTMDKLEFWGKVNFLKSGLVFADLINTVSERYSKEIQTDEYGAGLNGVLELRKNVISGIVNGVDYKIFSPDKDENIYKNYGIRSIEKKLDNKKYLLKEVGLRYRSTAPLIGIISRLADQKGFDLIAEIIDDLLSLNVQLVILGTGEPKYHKLFQEMEAKYPKNMKVILKFDPRVAQLIYAGSDMFLMPSKYEPCGLGQLISLKYGTIPIVRETGGLADTITDFDLAKDFEHDKGNGFVFEEYSSKELYKTILSALEVYKNELAWKKIMTNAMKYDYSWKASAVKYEKLYLS